MKYRLLFILAIFVLWSCGKDQMETDEELIQQYITDNNLDAKSLESGLYVVIEIEGSQDKPELSSEIEIDYEGHYLDGEKFDSSYDRGEPLIFTLAGLIEGWQLGIPEFGKGGIGTLLIPSHLGYGSNPPFGVREDAVLVFDIELINFN